MRTAKSRAPFFLSLAILLTPCAAATLSGMCERGTCEWSHAALNLLDGVTWTAEVGEVAPTRFHGGNLMLTIANATQAGTFFLVSPTLPAPPTGGSLSLDLRSEGALGRFALLVREADDPRGDTVFFHDPSNDWTFVSFEWHPKLSAATTLRIYLRGEVAAGANATIAFRSVFFGPDLTSWSLDGTAASPRGPRLAAPFSVPGSHTAVASSPNGSESLTLTVAREPPVAAFTYGPSPTILGGMRLDASASSSPWSRELVTNGDFSLGVDGWTLVRDELGAEVEARATGGTLRLVDKDPTTNGTAWLEQIVHVTPGVPYLFSWRAPVDDLGGATPALVLLEEGGIRHEVPTPVGARLPSGTSLAFTPTATELVIQVRAAFVGHFAGAATFDDVSLKRAMTFEWLIDGKKRASGVFADVVIGSPANMNVTLRVTDAVGVRGEVSEIVDADVLGAHFAVKLAAEPLVVLGSEGVTLDASPTTAGLFDALAGRTRDGAWVVEDDEAPGRVTLESEADGWRAIATAQAAAFGGGAVRLASSLARGTPLDLVFHYRTSGAVGGVIASVDDQGLVTRATFPAASAWQVASMRVPAASLPSGTFHVAIRAQFLRNASSSLEVRNITLAPPLTYQWNVTGHTTGGATLRLPARAPTVLPWALRVRTPGGVEASRTGILGFLAPSDPFPELSGGVAADWNATMVPSNVTMLLAGPVQAAVPGTSGRISTPGLVPGDYVLVALSPDGTRTVLGRATLNTTGDLTGPPLALTGVRGLPSRFSIRIHSPEVVALSLRLASIVQRYEIPLARAVGGGAFTGNWTPPRTAAPGTYRMDVVVVDGQGATGRFPVGTFSLASAPGDVQGLGWIVAALLIVAGMLWAPTWWRRRA